MLRERGVRKKGGGGWWVALIDKERGGSGVRLGWCVRKGPGGWAEAREKDGPKIGIRPKQGKDFK